MHNDKYLTLPIKSLNSVIKFMLQQEVDNFSFDTSGCTFRNTYFDFKVTKLVHNYELLENLGQNNDKILHINQIDVEQEIILCIIFKTSISCYLLNLDFYNIIKDKMSLQHKDIYHQLHISYKEIKENCECIINLK